MRSAMTAAAAACLSLTSAAALAAGPDIVVGELTGPWAGGDFGPRSWGTVNGITAYTVGTTGCNVGDEIMNWYGDNADHPLIISNLYRLHEGRFEQIGLSWVKHAVCALQYSRCQSCTPTGIACEDTLGVGCADPYGSSLNGSQAGIGPRSDINASTGAFTWPFTTFNQSGEALYKRMQVQTTDLDPGMNPGAIFFAEGAYVAADDALHGNSLNNASYRPVSVGDPVGAGFELNWAGDTEVGTPAIFAWRDHGGGLNIPDPTVQLVPLDVPGDGRFWLGTRVSANGDGTWHYEYAVENLNSHRAAGAFSVPISGISPVKTGFHDIDYHSGEPYDPTDWIKTETAVEVKWSSPEAYRDNRDTNALRWGTVYNFRFDSVSPPMPGTVTLGMFRPGAPRTYTAALPVPSPFCGADWNETGNVDSSDLLAFLNDYELAMAGQAPIHHDPDIAVPFGALNTSDFLVYINMFGEGCP